MAAKDVVIEAQSPINKKALFKALKPPVSIKTFFPVKSKTVNEVDVKPGLKTEVKNVCNTATSAGSTSVNDKGKSKVKPAQVKLLDSFGTMLPSTTTECPIVIDDGESDHCRSKEHTSGPRKRKLPTEPCGTNSLAKMFKRAETLSVISCPVCGLKIEDISNSAINLHIDKCLMNSTPPP